MARPLASDRDLVLRLRSIARDRRAAVRGLCLMTLAAALGVVATGFDVLVMVATTPAAAGTRTAIVGACVLAGQSALTAVLIGRMHWLCAFRNVGRREAWAASSLMLVSRAASLTEPDHLGDVLAMSRIEPLLDALSDAPHDRRARLALMTACVEGAAIASPPVRPWLLAHVRLMASAMGAKAMEGGNQ